MKTLAILITLALLVVAGQLKAQTNAAPDLPVVGSVSNLLGTSAAGLTHVTTDASAVFGKFSWSQPLDVSAVGIKNGDLWGGGVTISQTPTNSVVGLGFGVFGIQNHVTDAALKTTTKLQFYDATLSLSVKQVETIPVLNLPVVFRIETGPALKLSGGSGELMEQSAAMGSVTFDWFKGWPLTISGGVIHCSDPLFRNKALPFGAITFEHKF